MRIGINCGHTVSGQIGCGAVGYIDESVEVRAVGKRLMTFLRNAGHTVVDCTDDYSTSVSENLSKIVSKANAQPLDLFVSIHFNSGGGRGAEVYTYNGEKFKQAELVCENMAELGFVNRGIKNGSHLYVIRKSNALAMLVEVCFVDTKSDVDLYNKVGADKIAQALGDAIIGEKLEEELTMTQYEELKQMIEEQATEINGLKETNKSLMKVVESTFIYNYNDDNIPKWAKEALTAAIKCGAVQGDENALLRLNYKDLRNIVREYRCGLYN